MSKAKRNLKQALKAQQGRLAKKQHEQATHAAQESKTTSMKKVKKQKLKMKHAEIKTTVPYLSTDRILLVGEGDFSFALSLIRHHEVLPTNLTATGYDSEKDCFAKYPDAEGNVLALRQAGARVLFKIDATKLHSYKELKPLTSKCDKVAFNFPHTGKGITDQDRNILSNQQLILGFLKSTSLFLTVGPPHPLSLGSGNQKRREEPDMEEDSEDDSSSQSHRPIHQGTVLITLRDVEPYTSWDVPRLAKRPPNDSHPTYVQLRSFAFRTSTYPGYEHRRTAGYNDENEVDVLKPSKDNAQGRTWEYALKFNKDDA